MGVCCCLQAYNSVINMMGLVTWAVFDVNIYRWCPDPTCVKYFRPVPLTVFKILGFKLKKNDKKNWS